ncbi:MAG: IS1380 family transposase [Cyclobacteriaceae bacterium]|nr:IS1380 family transposase [Cyclobacteriaceae bacterium]
MDLKLVFTDKEITPWSGMIFMKKLLDRTGILSESVSKDLPGQGSNRGYGPIQLITCFMVSVWCGANRFEHLEVSRFDEVLRKIFGFKTMAGHKAYQRYFKKFTLAINQRVFSQLSQWFFGQIKLDNYTMDVDSTVLTRYGAQQGAKRGYNPNKPGRNSHHPLLAFVDECKMIANFWLRSGDAYTTNNFLSFLEDTIGRLKGKKISLLRADSGFYGKDIFNYLEQKGINYIIVARHYSTIQRKVAGLTSWWTLAHGLQVTETTYQSDLWEKPRRLVVVRQQIDKRPKATGKQLKLFQEEGIYENYRYSCYITNLDLSAKMVWDMYRGRADCENRIKELKEDFGFDHFNMQDFAATEAALNFVMAAYNIMSLFKQAVLQSDTLHQLKTLRYKIFAVGGYITKSGNQRLLHLSLNMKRRQWIEGIWNHTQNFS